MNECLKFEEVDPSMTVAKVICLDLGWHLEYREFDDMSANLLLVIPALRNEIIQPYSPVMNPRKEQLQESPHQSEVHADSDMTHESVQASLNPMPADCLLISCGSEKEFLEREFGLVSEVVDSLSQAIPILKK